MPGGRGVFPGLSVRENLQLGSWIDPEDDQRAPYVDPDHLKDIDLDEVLSIFPALASRLDARAGALSGGVCIREVPINQNGNCVFMQVLDPGHLGGADHFDCEVDNLVDFVRGCPRIEGVQEILLPGDPERRALASRTATGIPMDDGNWNELVKLAGRLNVEVPQV